MRVFHRYTFAMNDDDKPDAPSESESVLVPEFVHTEIARLQLNVKSEHLEKLGLYLRALLDTNQRVNLTGIRDLEVAWRKLVIDSLTALPGLEDLPAGSKVVDVGTGGGMPGLPLAVCRPDLLFTLIDSTGKKTKFIQDQCKSLHLPHVSVLNDRAETIGQQSAHRESFDLAVCRAIGPMRELLEYTLPLVRVGGAVLAMKGPSVEQELNQAGDALAALGGGDVNVFDAFPPEFEINTVIVHVTKESATPGKYPRLPGMPRQAPL
jgi:16S rRNA (guanine527-N7)-methyltransferase